MEILRPVSALEVNARAFGIAVSRSRIRGAIPLALFQEALEIIARRHPFLNAAVFDLEGKSYFCRNDFPAPPLEIREEVRSEAQRTALYEHELNARIDVRERLWRVLLVLDGRQNDLRSDSITEMIVSVQHSICDAVSILNLVQEILEQTSSLSRGGHLYEIKKLPVPSPFDEYLPDIIGQPTSEKLESKGCDRRDLLSIPLDMLDRDLSIPKAECRIKSIQGEFKDFKLKRSCCKASSDGISLHGVLAACLLKAIADQIGGQVDRDFHLLMRNPVSWRKHVSPPLENDFMEIFTVSELIITSFDRSTSILALARQFMNKLNREIAARSALRRYKAASEERSYEEINKEKEFQVVTFSNVGKIDIQSDYGDFELMSTNYISSHRHLALQVSATTLNNHMFYVINYTHPWYKTELMERFHRCFREYFLQYGQ
jgi:hypothetical protein